MPAERGLRGTLRLNESMARHVSWRAGGPADRVYIPADLDDLRAFIAELSAGEPICFVGLGSNLLIRDGGFRGTVVLTHGALAQLRQGAAAGTIHAGAGVATAKVARFAALHDLAGAEFLAGIPGTVGGALAMNAGCYGGETWNIVSRVLTLDRSAALRERTPQDYAIGYRSVARRGAAATAGGSAAAPASCSTDEWFVAAVFKLPQGNGADARRSIKELLARRVATQPLGEPNSGSVFRNPPRDHAARLIEACGLKGRTIGGAAISTRHANFIVNTGGARAADIEALIALAHGAVQKKFGIVLEREVRIVGDAVESAT